MSQPQDAGVGLPDALVDYFAQREDYRARAVAGVLSGLTNRERLLVREAAVMGWVQGIRHHDLAYPGDRQALTAVVDACLSFPDLYPTITNHASTNEES
ncbi:hypothetical protein ACWGB8_01640 [Kitasatospora sp. NPDC054939]